MNQRNKGHISDKVIVNVSVRGWLLSYFEEGNLTVTTTHRLADALPDIMSQVIGQARSPIPKGSVNILVNGKLARRLIQEGCLLCNGDEITLIPIVVGG